VPGSVFLREFGELITAAAKLEAASDETGLPPGY
jgi:hypothetical protein